jgi:hypothetical protein
VNPFEVQKQPSAYNLSPPSPNPFNPSTTIRYQLPTAGQVSLQVYDTAGRLITTLVQSQQVAGEYQVTFDGSQLVSGIYLARLTSGSYTATQKLALLK